MLKELVHDHFPLQCDNGCQLNLFKEEHAETLFSLIDANRNELRKWLPWVDGSKQTEDLLNFIRFTHEEYESDKALHLGIWNNDKLVGAIGFREFDWANKSTTIGYWLDKSHEGSGIMTTACKRMLGFAFKILKLNRVEIRCATDNEKNMKVIERLGLVHEGTLRQTEWLYDHFVDQLVYSMLVNDWTS